MFDDEEIDKQFQEKRVELRRAYIENLLGLRK